VAPPASSVKAVLSMQGLIGEAQRLPMVPVDGQARETLQELAEGNL
jgi:dihydrodipicolinate synthase/N-acetylneuraminate lyase